MPRDTARRNEIIWTHTQKNTLYTNVHNSIIHNSQKEKWLKWWADKLNAIYLFNGLLLKIKRMKCSHLMQHGWTMKTLHGVTKARHREFPCGLKIWCCHCSSSGHCCGVGLDPWPENFHMPWARKKKKPNIEGHILYDSIYMKCPWEVNP